MAYRKKDRRKDIKYDLLKKKGELTQVKEVGFLGDETFCEIRVPDRKRYIRSEIRQAIIALLKKTGKVMTPKEVAIKLSHKYVNTKNLMRNMAIAGEIFQTYRGKYVFREPE